MIGEMFYKDLDDETWQYELHTNPPEAIHWKNYKIKLKDIMVISTAEVKVKDRIKKEILKDIELADSGELKKEGKWWR
tara:strand:+ start:28 stop:261 length:234 start_codon:yes stop_codon:yes gene_type:complete